MGPGAAGNSWQRAVTILTGAVLFVIVIACLYWAQAVFIPVALAVFLTFLLSPPVMALQRRGVGRTPAVVIVVTVTGLLVVGLGWVLVNQARGLAASLPNYEKQITVKARQVGELLSGGVFKGLTDMSKRVAREVTDPNTPKTPETGRTPVPSDQPTPVVVEPAGATGLNLPIEVEPVFHGLAVIALVFILVVFMLLKREDLRNRLIRLIGHGRITTTTKAVDDAGKRISRYLLMQLVINSTFGTLFGLGLFALGVPYAALWGFLGGVLRYVPYIGAWIASLLPLTLSVATSDGWGQPIGVIALVLALELLANNLMEPLLYGHAIGVSEVALLIAAAFWAWLWGPIGLVLSGPLTVCLVVLGKYVPQLEFFDVILGDTPALEPRLVFYQRLLARDQDEAADVIEAYAKDRPPDEVYDDLLVNALNLVKRDQGHADLTPDDERFILGAVAELGDELAAAGDWTAADTDDRAGRRRARLLGFPAQDHVDATALQLLSDTLDPKNWDTVVVPVNLLTSELLTRVEQAQPDVLCVTALPPGGLAHTRYLCKRLRQRFPDLKIVIGRWGLAEEYVATNRAALTAAGADVVTTSLREARRWLLEWRPVFESDASPAPPVREPRERVQAGV